MDWLSTKKDYKKTLQKTLQKHYKNTTKTLQKTLQKSDLHRLARSLSLSALVCAD